MKIYNCITIKINEQFGFCGTCQVLNRGVKSLLEVFIGEGGFIQRSVEETFLAFALE